MHSNGQILPPRVEQSQELTINEATLLLERIRAGDGQAFNTVVRQYEERMHAVARGLLGRGEDSADAVQDALLAAYRSIASFKGEAKLWTWLYRVLVNACLSIRRSRRRRRVISLHDLPRRIREESRPTIPGSQWEEPAFTHAERAEMQAQVHDCIARLPPRYREVLLLRDIEELDTDQTAQRLATSPSTVKTRLHRARQALGTLLQPIAPGDRVKKGQALLKLNDDEAHAEVRAKRAALENAGIASAPHREISGRLVGNPMES
jgi:RNA polymerase sigma-70 factor (ECF subfamily)